MFSLCALVLFPATALLSVSGQLVYPRAPDNRWFQGATQLRPSIQCYSCAALKAGWRRVDWQDQHG